MLDAIRASTWWLRSGCSPPLAIHNRSGRTTDGCCESGHGDRILGAAAVIDKLQVLILPNADML
jgi:hypothetical protein